MGSPQIIVPKDVKYRKDTIVASKYPVFSSFGIKFLIFTSTFFLLLEQKWEIFKRIIKLGRQLSDLRSKIECYFVTLASNF
jgi:hypothetical protein